MKKGPKRSPAMFGALTPQEAGRIGGRAGIGDRKRHGGAYPMRGRTAAELVAARVEDSELQLALMAGSRLASDLSREELSRDVVIARRILLNILADVDARAGVASTIETQVVCGLRRPLRRAVEVLLLNNGAWQSRLDLGHLLERADALTASSPRRPQASLAAILKRYKLAGVEEDAS